MSHSKEPFLKGLYPHEGMAAKDLNIMTQPQTFEEWHRWWVRESRTSGDAALAEAYAAGVASQQALIANLQFTIEVGTAQLAEKEAEIESEKYIRDIWNKLIWDLSEIAKGGCCYEGETDEELLSLIKAQLAEKEAEIERQGQDISAAQRENAELRIRYEAEIERLKAMTDYATRFDGYRARYEAVVEAALEQLPERYRTKKLRAALAALEKK